MSSLDEMTRRWSNLNGRGISMNELYDIQWLIAHCRKLEDAVEATREFLSFVDGNKIDIGFAVRLVEKLKVLGDE